MICDGIQFEFLLRNIRTVYWMHYLLCIKVTMLKTKFEIVNAVVFGVIPKKTSINRDWFELLSL